VKTYVTTRIDDFIILTATSSPEEAFGAASNMLGHRLVTKQTSSSGLLVDKLYVAETMKYKDEMYLAMTLDRAKYCPAIIISKEGGVDIETLAKEHPEKLHKFWFNASTGVTPELIEAIQAKLELPQREMKNLEKVLNNMAKLFVAKDALLLEINPLVRTEEGEFICLDAKFNIDNAAKNRQKDLFALQDVATRSPDELEAEKHGLVYINLDGDIGNVVNGAGLAMATNDAISLYGGKSANFLDAGGLATKETFQKALEIILRDPRVKSILVNIYGGESIAQTNLENALT
jgi:succinyl-CoA synthetase beta subunit